MWVSLNQFLDNIGSTGPQNAKQFFYEYQSRKAGSHQGCLISVRGPTGACKCLGSKVMPDPTHNSRTLDSRGNTSLVALAARATALMRASSIFQTLLSPLFFVRSRFHSEVFLSPNPCPSPVFRARCFACFRQPKAGKLSAGSLLVGSHAQFFACF